MRYIASLGAGLIGSAFFWIVGNYLVSLPKSYQMLGMGFWFLVFGGMVFVSTEKTTPKS